MITFTLLSMITLSIAAFLIYAVTKQKVSTDFENTTTQILSQNMNYISLIDTSIEELSKQLLMNKAFTDSFNNIPSDNYQKFNLQKELQENIASLSGAGTSVFVNSIYLINDEGLSLASDGSNLTDDKISALKKTIDYKNAIAASGGPVWSKVHENTFSQTHEKTITFMRLMINPATMKTIGLLLINTDPKLFASSLKDAKIGQSGYIVITDKNGSIISNKNLKFAGKNLDKNIWSKVKTLNKNTFSYIENGKSMHGLVNTYALRDWKMIAVVPSVELFSTANSVGIISIPIILICILLVMFFSLIITAGISKPINEIIDVAEKVSNGDFTLKTSKYSIYELNQLSIKFIRDICTAYSFFSLLSRTFSNFLNGSNYLF
jgi:HAMP domain-containing protein